MAFPQYSPLNKIAAVSAYAMAVGTVVISHGRQLLLNDQGVTTVIFNSVRF